MSATTRLLVALFGAALLAACGSTQTPVNPLAPSSSSLRATPAPSSIGASIVGTVPSQAGSEVEDEAGESSEAGEVDDEANESPNNGQNNKVEGPVSGLSGICPSLTFSIGSTTVKTSAATQFSNVRCGAVANGMKVEAKGTLASGVLTATEIEK